MNPEIDSGLIGQAEKTNSIVRKMLESKRKENLPEKENNEQVKISENKEPSRVSSSDELSSVGHKEQGVLGLKKELDEQKAIYKNSLDKFKTLKEELDRDIFGFWNFIKLRRFSREKRELEILEEQARLGEVAELARSNIVRLEKEIDRKGVSVDFDKIEELNIFNKKKTPTEEIPIGELETKKKLEALNKEIASIEIYLEISRNNLRDGVFNERSTFEIEEKVKRLNEIRKEKSEIEEKIGKVDYSDFQI
ncbi:MAG: hypothetical protein WCO84_04450 [bacterium]